MPHATRFTQVISVQRLITPARKFRILAHTNPTASEAVQALPSLARRVRMSFFGARVIYLTERATAPG